VQRVRLGPTLLLAGVCYLLPLGVNVVASFLTEWTGGRSWLVAPAVGLLVAMVTALVQAFGSSRAPSPQPPDDRERWPGDVGPAPPSTPYRQRGTPLPVALAAAVLIIGGGGWAAAKGVRYAVGYITGNEPGTEQLVRQASGSADGLRLTVESVKRTAHFTRVRLQARNTSDAFQFTLNLHGCVFRDVDGTTINADEFKSRWPDQLSPGSLQRGTVTFKGHLPGTPTVAELTFNNVFSFPVRSTFDRGPTFITVGNIRLRAT
jgi:hypothetical protein